jgi:hypothetical protein
MSCSRQVAFSLCSFAWKISFPVVVACVLIGIFLKDSDYLAIGAEQVEKGRAVFSDQGTRALVTLGEPAQGNFSTCVIHDQDGNQLARVSSHHNGQVAFEFGITSTVHGSGVCRKNGAVAFGLTGDVKHQYDVTVQPDGSSVVHVRVRDDRDHRRVTTVKFSPSGDVLREQP